MNKFVYQKAQWYTGGYIRSTRLCRTCKSTRDNGATHFWKCAHCSHFYCNLCSNGDYCPICGKYDVDFSTEIIDESNIQKFFYVLISIQQSNIDFLMEESFIDKGYKVILVDTLKNSEEIKKHPDVLRNFNINHDRIYHAIVIGPFKTKESAIEAHRNLKNDRFPRLSKNIDISKSIVVDLKSELVGEKLEDVVIVLHDV